MPAQAAARRNETLARYTTFGIGGPADWFFEPRTLPELMEAIRVAYALSDNVRVLGGGSNLLIGDEGVRGAVISLRRFAPEHIVRRDSRVEASGGVRLQNLLRRCADWGLSGLEGMAGIPGTVGGAVRMNAGGEACSIGERVAAVTLVDSDGTLRRVAGSEITWRYRDAKLGSSLVAFVELDLAAADEAGVVARMDGFSERKRASQPLTSRSAGCFFRNPDGDSAGRLVDGAGLKGRRIGGAQVSRKHANFLVNRGQATAADVLRLVDLVKEAVRERFHVELSNEVHCWV